MKKRRIVAGLLSALLLVGAPGVLQGALAVDASGSGTTQTMSNASTKSYAVTADYLNVRAKADKDSKITAVLSKGDQVSIKSEKTDSRGVIWGQLSDGTGWINLDYTSKAGDSKSVTTYSVKVTAYSLNIRSVASLSGDVKGNLSKGDVVKITAEQKDSRGVTWGKLENGKGWISLKYAEKTDGSTSVTAYKVKVTAYNLNIRSKANKSSSINGVLKLNDVVTIVAEQKDSRGVTWGKLENGKGWISLDYAKKTSDSPSFTKYSVKVTAYSLNVRSKAGLDGTIKDTLSKGDVVTIVAEQKDSRGVTWGKLESGNWISLAYAEKISSTSSYQVKVTADSLNIRKNPNKDSTIVGYLKKGNVFTIVEESTDSRGVKWGKLKNGDGWINLNYTTKT